MFYLLTN